MDNPKKQDTERRQTSKKQHRKISDWAIQTPPKKTRGENLCARER